MHDYAVAPSVRAGFLSAILIVLLAAPATQAYDPLNGEWERSVPSHVRVMTWNVLDHVGVGVDTTPASPVQIGSGYDYVGRICQALDPDIICFQEVQHGSTINVIAAQPDAAAPSEPSGLTLIGGYSLNILDWSQTSTPDVAGYRVYRRAEGEEEFALIEQPLRYLTRFFDWDVIPGLEYSYRVAAVDVWGNEGPPTSVVSATPVDDSASTLPIFEIGRKPCSNAVS